MKDVFLFQKQISKKGPTLHSIEQQGTLENLEKELIYSTPTIELSNDSNFFINTKVYLTNLSSSIGSHIEFKNAETSQIIDSHIISPNETTIFVIPKNQLVEVWGTGNIQWQINTIGYY